MAVSFTTVVLQYLPIALVLSFVYAITLGIYRVYLSPLSHIPGPKLAAATRWYELYYDAYKVGKFYFEIEKMHEKYGPVVRINPFEVHISDPTYYNELYNMKLRLHKDPWYYSWLYRPGSIFATMNPDLHKLRSAPIKKGLSPTSISRVEHVLKEHLSRLMLRIQEHKDRGQLIHMTSAYRALATDIVTDISCPKSLHLLDKPGMGHEFHEAIANYTMFAIWNRQFTWIGPLLDSLPRWLVALQGDVALGIIDFLVGQEQQAEDVIKNDGKPIGTKSFPVIMNEVYKSPDIPPSQKTPRRLFEEIAILIAAGSETTSNSLLTTTYHVLANPEIRAKLQAELRTAFTAEETRGVLSYKQLEPLPYLTAVIHEGLRLATGVSGRLPRINKIAPTLYTNPSTHKTYTIPPNTPVSMTTRSMHYNAACYPSPTTFLPTRFLGDEKKESLKWFAPFGRGARSCVGQHLAMAEMYMVIGNLFARWDVRLGEGVDERDVDMAHECFAPFPEVGREGVLLVIDGDAR
ncbi:cytochrome P450 [Paraphaeosphaeria sporulosa]|uniref:Cytochrome P450 n=1 Tax=Paraphaeosphaeria sporulosa TaxID=1460663 RepID=A0A177CW56_9PLEO|nr:cytochrome P450 [Paraphaeosphaeria sporulosa]OAG11466.1 cytochrome P450 [Paraphaeosphaeria sporulosa]